MMAADFPDSRSFDDMASRLGKLFPRFEMREHLKGLLGQRNGWQLAEWLGDAAPEGVQYLLERTRWDP